VKAAWRGGSLTVQLKYPSQETGYTLIAGIARPEKVELNGAALEERADLDAGEAAGWQYSPHQACLVVRLVKDGESQVTVTGARYEWQPFVNQPVDKLTFEFDGDLAGWREDHDLTPLAIENGVATAQALGGDPWLIRGQCRIPGDSVKRIAVRMRVTAGATGQLYWTTEDSPGYAEDKVIAFPIQADGEFHEYVLDVGSHPLWRGKLITGLRLDPTNNAPDAKIGVDYIRGQ